MKPLLACLLLSLVAGSARAAQPCVDPYDRAGHPQCLRWFAKPSNGPKYSGGYVGGGSVLPAQGRCPGEGTWGWDYSGVIPLKRIWLDWSHERYQAGGGKYATDREKHR